MVTEFRRPALPSSFRLGEHPEQLIALLDDPSGPAAIIPNACGAYSPEGRVEGVQRELDAPGGLGIEADVLDLRDYFGAGETPSRSDR